MAENTSIVVYRAVVLSVYQVVRVAGDDAVFWDVYQAVYCDVLGNVLWPVYRNDRPYPGLQDFLREVEGWKSDD
jgi:hypothetical protein